MNYSLKIEGVCWSVGKGYITPGIKYVAIDCALSQDMRESFIAKVMSEFGKRQVH